MRRNKKRFKAFRNFFTNLKKNFIIDIAPKSILDWFTISINDSCFLQLLFPKELELHVPI